MNYLRKRNILILLSLLILPTFAISGNYKVIPCDNVSQHSEGCQKCYDAGHIYQGKPITIHESWTNESNDDDIIYLDENDSTWESVKTFPKDGSIWTITPDLLEYASPSRISLNGTGRKYIRFRSGTKNAPFLQTKEGSGIRFDTPGKGSDRNTYAFRIKLMTKFRKFANEKKLSEQKTMNRCMFFKPSWCGDGFIDRARGEECDSSVDNRCNKDTCLIIN